MSTITGSLIAPFVEHLSWVGFQIEWKEGKHDPYAWLEHPTLPNMVVDKFAGVVKLYCLWKINDATKENQDALLQVLNRFNKDAGAAKFYLDNDLDLIIEAVFPSSYSKSEFCAYWSVVEQDFRVFMKTDMRPFLA